MDRLDAMKLFVRVAELGSFAAVAQQLGVARSVVTRQIAALEEHLGVKLMVRTTRKLTLTSAGALNICQTTPRSRCTATSNTTAAPSTAGMPQESASLLSQPSPISSGTASGSHSAWCRWRRARARSIASHSTPRW